MSRAFMLLTAFAVALPSTALASGEPMVLQFAFGLGGAKTEWRGDITGNTTFKLGLRVNDYVAPYFFGRLGVGSVDERMLTFVSLGVQVWPAGKLGAIEPYFRFSIAHQHEETLFVVRDDPFGALFGIGDGIRHRGGFEGALGIDIPIYEHDGMAAYAGIEGSTVWFYDTRGPSWYVGANTAIGLAYDL